VRTTITDFHGAGMLSFDLALRTGNSGLGLGTVGLGLGLGSLGLGLGT